MVLARPPETGAGALADGFDPWVAFFILGPDKSPTQDIVIGSLRLAGIEEGDRPLLPCLERRWKIDKDRVEFAGVWKFHAAEQDLFDLHVPEKVYLHTGEWLHRPEADRSLSLD